MENWKYLGVYLQSGTRYGCSVSVKSFYKSLNSILRVEGRSYDMVMLRLIETHCVPILTYAIAQRILSLKFEHASNWKHPALYEMFSIIGNPFPIIGNPFPVIENPFPVTGNPFPIIGNPFPIHLETLTVNLEMFSY